MIRLFHRPDGVRTGGARAPRCQVAAGRGGSILLFGCLLVAGCAGHAVIPGVTPPPPVPAVLAPGAGRDGTELVIEPKDGAKPLVRAIDRAQRTVFLEAYILTDRAVVRALQRAAAQGVAVYALLDPRAFGMGTQPSRMAASLRAAGVAVRWSSARYHFTHAKLLVCDDRLAVISTANFSQSAFSANRELLAFDRARPDVHELSDLFRHDWDGLPFVNRDRELIVSPGARPSLAAVLHRARQSIDVYAEEIADPALDRLLVTLARHVRIRVLVAASYRSAGAAALERGGVAVRGLSRPYVHAKMVLVDGHFMFVGSENLSPTSLDTNREVGILLRGQVVRRAARTFDRDWPAAAALPVH